MAYANSANGWDYSKQKHWSGELSRYRDLEAQGINPLGTTHAEMDRSLRVADLTQKIEAADKAGDLGE